MIFTELTISARLTEGPLDSKTEKTIVLIAVTFREKITVNEK